LVAFLDVNVLLYAHQRASPQSDEYAAWLERFVSSTTMFGIPELVLAGFIRVATNPRAFNPPSTSVQAFSFLEGLIAMPGRVSVLPGPGHLALFRELCEAVPGGNDVTDAYLAALAIEDDAELITADRGFARFPGLRWRHPLDP
jgi:toxin-antitoxin system PIN domain toxin